MDASATTIIEDDPEERTALESIVVGEPVPPFVLRAIGADLTERTARLEDYQGRWLILIFYPRDFSFVCPTELTAFSARSDEFDCRKASLLGISVDSIELHQEWMQAAPDAGGLGRLRFPLGSDPDGTLAQRFGVWNHQKQVANRGLFLIDPEGVLQYSVVHNLSVGRSTDEVFRVLDALQTGGLCPVSWTRADGTLDLESSLQPGRILGHYRIRRKIGEGSFGSVYEAVDLRLERPVAFKILKHNDREARAMLKQEARAAARINDPNVCTIYSVEEEEGLPLIVMELLDGKPLSTWIESCSHRCDAASLAFQIGRGISAAHAHGVVHGDLKPGNVMVSDSRVKILDFGLAGRRRVQTDTDVEESPNDATIITTIRNRDGNEADVTVSGTPAYMSPEQASGLPPTTASDVFAFGLILFELLTGQRAMTGDSPVDVLLKLRSETLAEELASRVSGPASSLIRSMLDADPAKRPTIAEVSEALEEMQA